MEIVDVRYIGTDNQYQTYSPSDVALINTSLITANFGGPNDYIEYFIKDLNGEVLDSIYFTTQYKLGNIVDPITGTTTQLTLDPETDAREAGYYRGSVNVKYNFLTTHLQSSASPSTNFWIKEISTSRTEIKVARQDLSNTQLQEAFTAFNAVLSADAYYPTFYLNFGADELVIGVNAVYVEEDGQGYIIFKLYEPLPINFDVKSTFWVVTEAAEPANFNVTINVTPEVIQDSTPIKGPNFKVQINDKANQTTPYYSYASLFATAVTSSFQQIQSMMAEKGIQINVDYGNFENFVHFSSATERLYNYVYKLQLIESASAGLQATNTDTAKVLLQSQIDNTITNFDGYEYYLYFTSESTAWPKQNTTSPYQLYSVTSSQAINWLGSINTTPSPGVMSMYWSASYYDNNNPNLLAYATPAYILDDSANAPYVTFLNMIGQHFDNIWIYLKDVTSRYDANNNPFVGISMDQVSEALQSFGIQLYTNTSVADNLYYSMLGINETGSALPVTSSNYSTVIYDSSSIYPLAGEPYLTASLLLPPFGDEKINRYVLTFPSASSTVTSSFQTLSSTQLTDEVYKRLYHNLAYLLKTRGTERGVKALIATYGIPNDILTVHEYGGYNYLEVPGIQEISNTRILTGSVAQISSSLLSPNTTIQYYSNDLEKTSIDVEIGFSPADSINASITSSGYVTASNQPGYFNIMQLIGDPALQYSSSYLPLEQLSQTYFNAEYTSRYNVWDFIRVIKYYNNSLFKMLKDWVPARTSPSTGIVIKSHMLERNKYPRKEPTYTTSSFEADYLLLTVTGSDGGAVQGNTNYLQVIPIQYSAYSAPLSESIGYVFMSSSDDVQKYNGEFDGTTIVASVNYFPQQEVSDYAYPWTSSVAPSQHGGENILFLTYSLSPTFQNISGSVISQRFLDLDFGTTQLAPTNYGLITKSLNESLMIGPVSQSTQPYSQYAQYQDYNHNFRPITIPRYSGSYLSGLYYNTYSTRSATYPGDVSYGQSPVINYNTSRLGLFTQVATSSFIPGKVNATLGYFADVSGGLFELNQNNRNWQDVQNTFKAGTTATIKQFDNKKYSNQVSTDGIKAIYNSGYNYSPQLYFSTASVNGNQRDTKIYFQYVGSAEINTAFVAANSLTPGIISGSAAGTENYPVTLDVGTNKRAGNIYNIFDSETVVAPDFSPGTSNVFPSYTASVAGQRTFTVVMGMNIEFQDPTIYPAASGSYSFGIYQNGTSLIGTLQTVNFTSSFSPGGTSTGSLITYTTPAQTYTAPTFDFEVGRFNGPFNWFYFEGGSNGTIGNANSRITASYYSYRSTPLGPLQFATMIEDCSSDMLVYFKRYDTETGQPTRIYNISSGGTVSPPSVTKTAQRLFLYTTPAINLNPDDKVVFKFRQEGMSTNNFTSSVQIAGSYLSVNIAAAGLGDYPYATASQGAFIQDVIELNTQQSQVVLSQNLSQYLGYQFVPAFTSASVNYTSSLYSQYGDINYSFNPQPGDKLILQDNSGLNQDLNILETSIVGGQLYMTVVPSINQNWIDNPTLIQRFLLLKRYNDEQNVILTFNKNPGQTSYGFLIPQTISTEVTNNINTLQAAVQSQLLSNQSNSSNTGLI